MGERTRAGLRGQGAAWAALSVADREARVAEMVLTGYTIREIATALGASVQGVHGTIKRVTARWREAAGAAIDEHIARQMAKLDRLESEYWDAWRRSCEDREIRASRSLKRPGKPVVSVDGAIWAGAAVESTEASLRTERGEGNPAFLAGVERCVDQRNRLLGLYKTTVDVNLGFNLDDAFSAATTTIEANATRRAESLERNKPVAMIEGDIDEAMREDGEPVDEEAELLAPPDELVAELDAEMAGMGAGVTSPGDDEPETEVA